MLMMGNTRKEKADKASKHEDKSTEGRFIFFAWIKDRIKLSWFRYMSEGVRFWWMERSRGAGDMPKPMQ